MKVLRLRFFFRLTASFLCDYKQLLLPTCQQSICFRLTLFMNFSRINTEINYNATTLAQLVLGLFRPLPWVSLCAAFLAFYKFCEAGGKN